MNGAGISRNPATSPAFDSYSKMQKCAGPCGKTRSIGQFAKGSALCLICARRKPA